MIVIPTLDERKQKILKAIVQDYLETASPVGSRHLSKRYNLDISPATIRNEMAELEEDGFLKHPYTSAGRVPSDAGYRYFVNQLMKMKDLSRKDIDFIEKEYKKAGKNLEELLHTTLKIAAALSHLLAVITAPKLPFKVLTSGLMNIMRQPEFSDAEHIKNILSVIEREDLIEHIIDESAKDEDVTIRIGSEIKHKKIKDCSIVVSRYDLFGESLGTISIIGPTRMTYDKVTAVVDVVSKTLKKVLTQKS
jgi:transcriptional regulator of heat shock response